MVALVHGQGTPYDSPVQYHIQTDEGPERFFRFQTETGQYREEKRHLDGSVTGTYGWVDPNGILRLFDYISDKDGYRIDQEREFKVCISILKGAKVLFELALKILCSKISRSNFSWQIFEEY